MSGRNLILLAGTLVALAAAWVFLPSSGGEDEVVVYVAHDQVYSGSVLERFTEETGIPVRARWDTEATKSAGLARDLMAERDRPVADVFWNNEVSRLGALAEAGVLAPWVPETAADIPDWARDPEGRWHGFAARVRVIVHDPSIPEGEVPTSLEDLVDPAWRGEVAIADPRFGTTGSHVAALLVAWGEERLRAWLRDLRENDVMVVPGNGPVCDRIANGVCSVGLTDSSDVWVNRDAGRDLGMLLPDQGPDGLGTLVVPNAVALVEGGPNPEAGKTLVRWLLREETEGLLAASASRQIPLRDGVEAPDEVYRLGAIRRIEASEQAIMEALPRAMELVEAELIR